MITVIVWRTWRLWEVNQRRLDGCSMSTFYVYFVVTVEVVCFHTLFDYLMERAHMVNKEKLLVSQLKKSSIMVVEYCRSIPRRPSKGVPSERLLLVKWFISHRLHTGHWGNLVLHTYCRVSWKKNLRTSKTILHLMFSPLLH